ncbi:hypothetical protein KP509_03G093000 [Ceratopteris richardii]|uniref:Fe2OG dioxygenase domain-containing protein n=2 Tax=Ceratopteris richardii TaxID=49495 RepID=A0A8T2VDL7_CERRI|nr:hypothetical protein KP509_03G093000 [Ceratopteris richardii]
MAPAMPPPVKLSESDLVEKISKGDEIPANFILPVEHRPEVCLTRSSDEIPVVDLAGLDGDKREEVLSVIHKACLEWGFFQVVNHGVDPSVQQYMKDQVEEFLALPVHERAPGGIRKGVASQGYGTGYVKPDTGARDWRDYFLLRTYPESMRDYETWPNRDSFRDAISKYTLEMKKLAEKLLECLSINLGLAPNALKDALGELHQDLLINHYPPCPNPSVAIGANKHTDLGGVTCLWQLDDVVGLQVLKDGEWYPVHPKPGAYIINVADMVEVASNGIYKSIQHRAVVNPAKRRVSIAAFYDLHPDAVVKPIPELVSEERPACPAVRFGDHAMKLAIETDKVGLKVVN